MSVEPVQVALGPRSYSVVLGALSQLGPLLSQRRPPGRCVVVSNSVVGPLYGQAATASLRRSGFDPSVLTVPDGEVNKTVDTFMALVTQLLELGVDRQTVVVGLGGGVTTDIAGFAAASVMRGLPLVQVPTSLLAMVDASVGGKTGVNMPQGKNLLGAFYQPELVLAAMNTLPTLSDAELRCGLGEVVKHALIADAEFFCWLEDNSAALLARRAPALAHAVSRCCAIKAQVVAQDEREVGLRMVLNAGHTIGHALEKVLGFGALRHGEAVGVGLVAEAWIAVQRGEAQPDLPERIACLLRALGLPTKARGVTAQQLVEATRMDKKRAHGRLRLAYPVGVGQVRREFVTPQELAQAAQRAVELKET